METSPAPEEQPEIKSEQEQEIKQEDQNGSGPMQTDNHVQEETKEEPSSDEPPKFKEPLPTPPPHPLLAQYNDQWKRVTDNQNDFTAWTTLIGTAEKLDDIERLRAVYEPFLASYPLCYGYWKKFADAENRHKNVEAALSVFERGVSATPYSMDLWGHYANYKKSNGGTADEVRSIYERAIAYNGTDYVAHTLWDKYIHFEEEQGSTLHVVSLYSRALQYPLRELSRFMSSLRTFAAGRSSGEIMSVEEAEALMESCRLAKEQEATAAALAAADGAGAEQPPVVDTSVSDDDVKAAWLAQHEAAMEVVKKLAEARKPFEEGIKRSYFHVKPLDTPQLLNWIRYLDFMESGDDVAAAVIVYERCLVPCASYPELWERYVHWLQRKGMESEAGVALQRAVNVFCRTRPEIYLLAARYEEARGRPDAARAHYDNVLTKVAPKLLSAIAAAANFERRQGQLDAACSRYAAALEAEKATSTSTNGNNIDGNQEEHTTTPHSKLFAFLSMQYANFLSEVCRQPDKAREVLKEALAAAPTLRNLWEAAIHLELSVGGEGVFERVAPLFECACAEPAEGAQGLPEKDREELSLRFVEVADAHGDAAALERALATHTARFTLPSSLAAAAAAAGIETSKKRAAEERKDEPYYKQPRHEAMPLRDERMQEPGGAYAGHTGGTPPPAAVAPPPPYNYPAAPAAPAAAAARHDAAYPGYPPYGGHHYPPPAGGYPPYGHYGYGY